MIDVIFMLLICSAPMILAFGIILFIRSLNLSGHYVIDHEEKRRYQEARIRREERIRSIKNIKEKAKLCMERPGYCQSI